VSVERSPESDGSCDGFVPGREWNCRNCEEHFKGGESVSTIVLTEDQQVIAWREICLIEAGYTMCVAAELAEDTSIDLHRAVELLESGCPEQLALEILR